MLGLYRLLPEIIRTYDAAARGGESVGTLQKIVECLELELDATSVDIDGLKTLHDPDTVDPTYLALLGQLLGLGTSKSWSEEKRRVFLKTVGMLWHIKGTRPAMSAQLRAHGYIDHFPWELWKTTRHEENDYSLYYDYTHTIRAARIDIRTPAMTSGDQGVDVGGTVEPFRPIHVLIRKPGGTTTLAPTVVPTPSDMDYAGEPLDTQGVGGCPLDTAVAPNDAGIWFDPVFPVVCAATGLEVTTTCVGFCELSCQTACDGSMGYCQVSCTLGACELICQSYCDLHCQLGCQGSCVTTCVASCQLPCMSAVQVAPPP